MNKFRTRIFSLITAILFLLVPLHFPIVAEEGTADLVLVSSSGKPGDIVTVNLVLSNNPGVAYLKISIDYDSSLSIISATDKEILHGMFTTSKTTDVKPYVLQWMGADSSSKNGAIAEIKFKIADQAEYGAKQISITVNESYDELFNDVKFNVTNNSINIKHEHIPGDINNDKSVNNKDLLRLFKYLSGWNVTINEAALDVNGDGFVNNKDINRLFQYLSNWNVEIF